MYALGQKHKTDKIYHHGYHRFYEDFLNKYRKKNIHFLEIGMDRGKSHQLWKEYFPKAHIFGLEIKEEYQEDRLFIMQGDQNKLTDLKKLLTITGPCEVILDDGSHVPSHQMKSFNFLFEHCLTPGGVYIIEDIETSYWRKNKKAELYGYNINAGFNSPNNVVNIFREIVPIVNREFLQKNKIEEIKTKSKITDFCLDNISSITFGMNCIIIKKMSLFEKEKFGDRVYRFDKYI
jgi:hypothetical protein